MSPFLDPVQRAEYNRIYRQKNRARLSEKHREYVALNGPALAAYLRLQRTKHPARFAFYDANKRARGLGIPAEVERSTYESLWDLACIDCGKVPAGGVDHIVALSRGGAHADHNLRPCCLTCNKKKGGRERAGLS